MTFVLDGVLVRDDPQVDAVPLVFDSPHSGTVYPADFAFVCPLPVLRQAEDTYVDELFARVPEVGATLLSALFPRSYIDPNRAIDDIDPEMLGGRWPQPLRPSDKSRAGYGLIRRLCRPGVPVYDGCLGVAQVAERIDHYYRPYHDQLVGILDQQHGRFGQVFHINCHSMPALPVGEDAPMPDFVLGDRDGVSCDASLRALVADTLTGLGYRVAINVPYKGVELVRRYACPARGIHSLQLEIRRSLYMNEETLEKHDGFGCLQDDLMMLATRLAAHACQAAACAAAE